MHLYPDAPEQVAFLKNLHRHVFYVELQIEVFHQDRELEFFIVRGALQEKIESIFAGGTHTDAWSCEMLARELQQWAKIEYPRPLSSLPLVSSQKVTRKVSVKVFEDDENGAYVKED